MSALYRVIEHTGSFLVLEKPERGAVRRSEIRVPLLPKTEVSKESLLGRMIIAFPAGADIHYLEDGDRHGCYAESTDGSEPDVGERGPIRAMAKAER